MSYKETLAQIEVLKQQAEAKRREEMAGALAEIRAKMAEYGITVHDLQPLRKTLVKVAPKYRDAQGNTWTGRGKMPRWMAEALEQGHSKQDFRISA